MHGVLSQRGCTGIPVSSRTSSFSVQPGCPFVWQSERPFRDLFREMWKAFTDHPVIPLKSYAGKTVSIGIGSI